MNSYRFYKDESGWFIDLKYFPFNKAWLAMVGGADDLLDKLSDGRDEVTLLIDTAPFPYTDGWLVKELSSLGGGAIYNAKGIEIENNFGGEGESQLWLCPATLWVFLKYPKKIYYKVDHTKVEDKESIPFFSFLWKTNSNLRLA